MRMTSLVMCLCFGAATAHAQVTPAASEPRASDRSVAPADATMPLPLAPSAVEPRAADRSVLPSGAGSELPLAGAGGVADPRAADRLLAPSGGVAPLVLPDDNARGSARREGDGRAASAATKAPCACADAPCAWDVAGRDEHARRRFALSFDGYLRVSFSTFMVDRFFFVRLPASAVPSDPNVGRNDGFALGNARLNLRGAYGDDLYVRLGFDGALVSYADSNDAIGRLSTGLKDAYLRYSLHRGAQVYVGRFKPPFDIEERSPEVDSLFAHRALESVGVGRTEGYSADMPGFAPGRQLGVMVTSPNVVTDGGLAFGYAAALTNGNSGDMAHNDNDLPALWLRLQGGFGAAVTPSSDEEGPATFGVRSGGLVGLSGFYNERTFGLVPNRYNDRTFGAGVDAAVTAQLFEVQGQLLWSRTQHLQSFGASVPTDSSLGGHVQLGIHIPDTGFTPAYRFALYNPRYLPKAGVAGLLSDTADYDQVMHHTIGVRYRTAALPLIFWAEYTRSLEQGARAIANDRVELATQVNFE